MHLHTLLSLPFLWFRGRGEFTNERSWSHEQVGGSFLDVIPWSVLNINAMYYIM